MGYKSNRRTATYYAMWYKALNGLPMEYDERRDYKKLNKCELQEQGLQVQQ